MLDGLRLSIESPPSELLPSACEMLCPVGNPRSAWVNRCQFDIVLLRLSLFSSFFFHLFIYSFFFFIRYINMCIFFLSRLFTVWSVHFNRFGFGFSILMVFVRSFAKLISIFFFNLILNSFHRLSSFWVWFYFFDILTSPIRNSHHEILFGCSYSFFQNLCYVCKFIYWFAPKSIQEKTNGESFFVRFQKRMTYEIKETNFRWRKQQK